MENNKLSLKTISANLFVYGTSHALIDLVCVAVVFSVLKNQLVDLLMGASLIILYSVLAFGLQALFGLISDYSQSPRITALLGCIFTGISAVIFMYLPILAIVFAGIGNALFHVGGGSISLNLTPKKASAPGVYVAPGAIGLLIGMLLGKSGQFVAWPFILALVIFCILMFIVKKPEMNYANSPLEKTEENKFNYFEFILLLVFLSVAVRSLVGMVIVFPWKANFTLLIILTVAVVLGKALGGIIADRFGWIKIAVGALVLSIPFLIFGKNIAVLGIIGMFLFNITMPITLVAISNILPGRPGFAFGITCFALILGALPSFFPIKQALSGQWFIFGIIVISAVALYFGLRLYFRKFIRAVD